MCSSDLFTFHNAILTWITTPLNNALTQVGRIIETQNKATWTIKEQNATTQTKPSQIASKLQHQLTQAANVANEELKFDISLKYRFIFNCLNGEYVEPKYIPVSFEKLF